MVVVVVEVVVVVVETVVVVVVVVVVHSLSKLDIISSPCVIIQSIISSFSVVVIGKVCPCKQVNIVITVTKSGQLY